MNSTSFGGASRSSVGGGVPGGSIMIGGANPNNVYDCS